MPSPQKTIGSYQGKPIYAGSQDDINRQVSAIQSAPRDALTSSSLAPQRAMTLPPSPPPTAGAGLQGFLETQTDLFGKTLAAQTKERETSTRSSFDDLIAGLNQTTGKAALDSKSDATLQPLSDELTDINNQILSEQEGLRRQIEAIQKNPGVATTGQRDRLISEAQRVSLRKQADLSVIQLAKQGKFDAAKAVADRAIAAQLEEQLQRLDTLKFIYAENKDLFSRSEQRQFEVAQADRERQFQNDEYRLRAEFDAKIKQSDPLYRAQLAKLYAEISQVNNPQLGGTLNGKPQTAAQVTLQGYADRTTQADQIISRFGDRFASGSIGNLIGSKQPFNIFKSSERQQYEQAQRNFVNAVLRRESGAVISEEEFDNARIQYFPRPGDSPEVIAQKAENRSTVINNLYLGANKSRPAQPGSVIEDADGIQYLVGEDGETLSPI